MARVLLLVRLAQHKRRCFTSSSAQACSYTYANGVLTLNGSATFSKLSDTVTATGTIPAGTYYSCLVFLDVAADGSLSIRVPADATDLFTGKWRYDGTTFYVLNTALNVVTKYAFSSMAAVSTGSQGNSCYYNYAGSSANGFDAFSLLLDADGSYQIYLWNQTVTGTMEILIAVSVPLEPGGGLYLKFSLSEWHDADN